MTEKSQKWSEPPQDRPILALARNAGIRELQKAVWIVAEWNVHAQDWHPVRVHGDPDTGVALKKLIAWHDLPGDE
jgi:hypothetical protein